MKLSLIRTVSDDSGTRGRLTLPDGRILLTGELTWKANAPGVSCIPNGLYPCVWGFSPHFNRELYHVTKVPGREAILIHPANYMGDTSKGFKSDLEGCIALGMAFGNFGEQIILTRSREAIGLFEAALNKQPFDLEISYL